MKYRKKPEIIDVWIWDETKTTLDKIGCGYRSCDGHGDRPNEVKNLTIKTPVGVQYINKGDYIIKTAKGEFYLCEPDIFEATYEKTDNNSSSSNDQQGSSSTTTQLQIPKPPYIPSPIRMTLIENGLTMDKLETKTIKPSILRLFLRPKCLKHNHKWKFLRRICEY